MHDGNVARKEVNLISSSRVWCGGACVWLVCDIIVSQNQQLAKFLFSLFLHKTNDSCFLIFLPRLKHRVLCYSSKTGPSSFCTTQVTSTTSLRSHARVRAARRLFLIMITTSLRSSREQRRDLFPSEILINYTIHFVHSKLWRRILLFEILIYTQKEQL